jgi:hypothetical protein
MHFVSQQESYDISAEFMSQIAVRPDMLDLIIWQIMSGSADGVCGTYYGDTTIIDVTWKAMIGLLTKPRFTAAVKDAYIYAPFRRWTTPSLFRQYHS